MVIRINLHLKSVRFCCHDSRRKNCPDLTHIGLKNSFITLDVLQSSAHNAVVFPDRLSLLVVFA